MSLHTALLLFVGINLLPTWHQRIHFLTQPHLFRKNNNQNWSLFYTCTQAAHISAALPCFPISTQQPRKNSDLSRGQKTFLHPCQLLHSLAPHFHTSNIKINQAFAHLWQVTSQWLTTQCFLLTKQLPLLLKFTQAVEGGLEYKPVLLLQGQEHTTCSSCAFASPSETASIKVTAVYSGDLNKMKFAYRSRAQSALQSAYWWGQWNRLGS